MPNSLLTLSKTYFLTILKSYFSAVISNTSTDSYKRCVYQTNDMDYLIMTLTSSYNTYVINFKLFKLNKQTKFINTDNSTEFKTHLSNADFEP